MKNPITIDNLPESINFHDLNESWAALETHGEELIKKGKELDLDNLVRIGKHYLEIAEKFHRIMHMMPTDSKMVVINPYTKEVFDYAFRDTLGVQTK